jgi:Nucleoside 2-deoxyribosyltransferase like
MSSNTASASASDHPRPSSFQNIKAPAREATVPGNKSIFFSGSIKSSMNRDWQEELAASLSHLPVTIFNPRRVGIAQVVLASLLLLILSSPTGMTPG